MKVRSFPSIKEISKEESGIRRVIEAYYQGLPRYGIEFQELKTGYDIAVAHAGGAIGADIVHCHGLYWTADYDAGAWEWHVNRHVVNACRSARFVTVPSNWVAETFRREMRLDPFILPHGINYDDWQFEVEQGDHVLWNKNRKGDVCDPAPIHELAKRNKEQHFITTFAPQHKTKNVEVIGVVPHEEMKAWVGSSQVYLATTKETFGIGILEAMACGVPVLGFAHGGILDLVTHGKEGYLASPGNYDDLNTGLEYCLKHRDALGKNGRKKAKEFTWEKACEKVAYVYNEALKPEPATVSIIIPHFNYAGKVEGAIRSAMEQDYEQLENIIVVDDGSDDPSKVTKIVDKLADEDPRVQLILQENNGVASARNKGIDNADTKYVCCLDADDKIMPTYISKMVPDLEIDRSLGITYSRLHWYKPDGTDGISEWPDDWEFDWQLKRRNQIPTCCVFRKTMWERLGGYKSRYCPEGAGSEDAEFWTRSGAYGWRAKLASREALFLYAWMSGNVTGKKGYREPDWLQWHPWAHDAIHPFASLASPKNKVSHPVRQYDMPGVSVIIPVGPGHTETLIDALDSLEAQTYRNWEAIVVWDDPIEDFGPRAKFEKAYPHVKFTYADIELNRPGENVGAGVARNLGVKKARAPFLLFLDADDYLTPRALDFMFEAYREDEAIIYSDYVGKAIVDDPKKLARNLQQALKEHDEETGAAVISYRSANFEPDRAQAQPVIDKTTGMPFIWCLVTALIPKIWHDEIGGFDENIDTWEDVDYHWRMAKAGKCYIRVAEELVVYNFTSGFRRERGLQDHKEILEYLREKYKEIETKMCGCRGDRKSYKPTRGRAPLTVGRNVATQDSRHKEAMMRDQDLVMARYLSPNKGKHRVIGSHTKTNYGRRAGGDVFLVHTDDVRTQPHLFQLQRQAPPVTAPQPTAPPDKLPEPKVIAKQDLEAEAKEVHIEELQLLPGVTPAIADGLEKLGIGSIQDVLDVGVDGLLPVKGIGERKAELIVTAAGKIAV